MTTKKSKNRPQLRDRLLKLKAGVATHLSGLKTVQLAGTAMTPTDLGTLIQGVVDQLNATDAARATLRAEVAATKASSQKAAPVLRALEQLVRSMFAADDAALGDFGLEPRKVPLVKTKQKAQAADKGLATRTRRHVMGSRQKKDEAKLAETASTAQTVKPLA